MEPRLRINIDQLLKQKNLRASDLSKLTGIPKQTISEWRSGLVPKSILALKRVASAFGVSLDELVFHAQAEESIRQFRPRKASASTSEVSQRSDQEGEALWLHLDSEGYLRNASPRLLRELDYGTLLLWERPFSEYVLIEDWPKVQALLSGQAGANCSFRVVCRDHRLLSLKGQVVQWPGAETVYRLDQEDKVQGELRDDVKTHSSLELLQSVLDVFSNESWQPKLSFQLAYEGSSLPWLETRRQAVASSLLASLHNLAGWASLQPELIQQLQNEIRVESFGDTLHLRIQSPSRHLPAEILDLPRTFASDTGLRWTIHEKSGQSPELIGEIPLQSQTN